MSHNISIESGTSVKLKTAGKYCDRDIVVTATGGGDENRPVICISENPTLNTTFRDVRNIDLVCETATEIADSAFYDTTGELQSLLSSVSLPNVTSIGSHAFSGNQDLLRVDAPNVVTIGANAFSNCWDLACADFPNAITIGEFAFSNCIQMKRVSLPSVENIPRNAVRDCELLESINVPKAVTIGKSAFSHGDGNYNDRLAVVDLPKVTSIDVLAFRSNRALKAIILRTTETVCVCSLDAFEGTPIMQGAGHIYVPAVMYEYYRAGYEDPINTAMGAGAFDFLFRKIEDYPEICG